MKYGVALLTAAAKKCGGLSSLAKELGVKLPNVSNVNAGKRELPEEWVPGLAVLAEVDLTEALHYYRLEKYGPEDQRVRVLTKKGVFGEAAMWRISNEIGPLQSSHDVTSAIKKLALYTSWNLVGKVRSVFQPESLRLSALRHSILRLSALSHGV